MRRQEAARAALWTIIAAYVLSFMEWLFFSVMPSVLSRMDVIGKLQVLGASSLWIALFSLACFSPLALLAQLFGSRMRRILLALAPSLILSVLAILMVDNFSTTVMKVAISRMTGVVVALYAAGALLAALCSIAWFVSRIRNRYRWLPVAAGVPMACSGFVVLLRLANPAPLPVSLEPRTAAEPRKLPHIFLIGVDGIEATHMSFYGYERTTTPSLDRIRSQLLYAENALSCGGYTRTAVTGMLTGKFPLRTGVFRQGALAGESSFEHLPGILKRLGYSTLQFGSDYYLESDKANMQAAFDEVNGRPVSEPWPSWIPTPLAVRFSPDFFLADTVASRIWVRILHLAGRRPMPDIMTNAIRNVHSFDDTQRIDSAIDLLERAEGPVFVHLHLVTTHCCEFSSSVDPFSRPGMSEKDLITAKYDATILESDAHIARLLRHLREKDLEEESLFIYYSDHGRGWSPGFRVPLVFRFPGGRYAGSVRNVVSLLDVAPTILDYLDRPVPAWMEGVSILSPGFENLERKLFAVPERYSRAPNHPAGIASRLRTRFVPGLTYFECNRWYDWSRATDGITQGTLAGYTGPCRNATPPMLSEVIDIMLEELEAYGLLR